MDSVGEMVIRTKGLARAFQGRPAVKDLTIEVGKGELFGLVGPDGAGKSTAVRMLCGLLRPTAGTGMVLGRDLITEPESIKPRIGYLSQQFTLYGDLSVDENVAFFAELHDVKGYRERRDQLLEFMDLARFRSRLAGALSGGMKKKLALACTLVHTPDLLLLDEPSTGVDPVSRGEFWTILSTILGQGVTIVMTTPYLDEAERCHRIGLMHQGEVIRCGSPAGIRGSLPGAAFDLSGGDLAMIYGIVRRRWPGAGVVRYGDRIHVHVAGGEAAIRQVAAAVEGEGAGHVDVRAAETSLDDVFVGLLGGGTGTGDRA